MSVMAAANYNEIYNTVVTGTDGTIGANNLDPMFHWDTHFPERLSRLNPEFSAPSVGSPAASRARSNRSRRNRNAARFKTQPITFDEIKEVDEEGPTDDSKETLKSQFTVFSRSMDGLVTAPYSKKDEPSSSSSAADAGGGGADSAGSRSSEERAAKAAQSSAAAAIQRQQFRQRRKKRHTKSIEEAPELRNDPGDTTG